MLGFSVLAGILVTVMVTPALALTSVTASNGIGIFESLPETLTIGKQPQENRIIATNAAGEDKTALTPRGAGQEPILPLAEPMRSKRGSHNLGKHDRSPRTV